MALPLTLPANAKLNLRLHVGPKLDGPLHEIASVIADLRLADELEFQQADAFSVSCDVASIAGQSNLVWRAAMALGVELPSVHIHIRKRIPMQAGLGGGSADAATALHGIAALCAAAGKTIDNGRLERAASATGSDVPACMVPGIKIVEGYGERVARTDVQPPPWGIVLFQPRARSATASAYQALDAARSGQAATIVSSGLLDIVRTLREHDFEKFCGLLENDFQPVIERSLPQVASARMRLRAIGAQATILCGSGSAVAGFFPDCASAQSAHEKLRLEHDEWSAVTAFNNASASDAEMQQ